MPSRKASPGAVTPVKAFTVLRSTQFTGTGVTGIPIARPPQAIQVTSCSAIPRAKGGTHAASTITILAGATQVAVIDMTAAAAGVRSEAPTILSELVAADVELTATWASPGGTAPTFDDVLIQVDYVERY